MHNGVYGRVFTSMIPGYTENSVFIPVTGYMYNSSLLGTSNAYYWLNTLASDTDAKAASFMFHSGAFAGNTEWRYEGLPIRPVYNP